MKRYRLILADPPWRYRARRVNGAAEKHYKTMSTTTLCQLLIQPVLAEDAVLILWATWPLAGAVRSRPANAGMGCVW